MLGMYYTNIVRGYVTKTQIKQYDMRIYHIYRQIFMTSI